MYAEEMVAAVGTALSMPRAQCQQQALQQTVQCLELLLMCPVTLYLMRTTMEVCVRHYFIETCVHGWIKVTASTLYIHILVFITRHNECSQEAIQLEYTMERKHTYCVSI